ncbi:MAG: DUF5615 family PIN-like protein [Thermoanaerobaculia bacterium]|nr:DUF5615 family PIN-like protein [Thermoanaerobaculia bacterium]
MKLLADESVDFGLVRALRAAGFDVVAIAEQDPGIPDVEVASRAYRELRILLTEDKDFGQLVYATGISAHGVLFIRFPASLRAEMIASGVEIVQRFGDRLTGQFVVVEPAGLGSRSCGCVELSDRQRGAAAEPHPTVAVTSPGSSPRSAPPTCSWAW